MGKLALAALNRVPFGTYSAAIEEFTRRTLSNPADGINAVQGVLGTLTPRFGTFYAGLPQDFFGAALLWDAKCGDTTEKYTPDDAPFPSWSWARWNFPNGCEWSTLKPSRTCLLPNAYIVTTGGGIINLPASERGLQSREGSPYETLSPSAETHLAKVGHMLLLCSSRVAFRIGRLRTRNRSDTDLLDNTVYEYELLDVAGDVNGYICMPAMERHKCGRRTLEFITICQSTGYNGPKLPSHLIPIDVIKDENGNNKIVKMKPKEYPVTDIMLVNWTNDVAERVAIGHVVGKDVLWRKEYRWALLA